MTPQKVLEVIGVYRKLFVGLGIKRIEYPHQELLENVELGLAHCHGMLDKMEEFVREGRIDKASRWLGFIQGVLWAQKIYALEHLKHHNRPSSG